MPAGEKERSSVYQKALVICHEDQKQLNLLQRELEKDRLQKYIDYKLESKRLQKELLALRQEQLQLMNEARKNKQNRKTVDDIAKESLYVQSPRNRNLEAMKLKKKFSLPVITPTQNNVPKIMKRNLSYESEFFTWTFGLPRLENGPQCKEKKRNSSTESYEYSDSSSEKNLNKTSINLSNCEEEIKLPAISTENNKTTENVGKIASDLKTKLPSIIK